MTRDPQVDLDLLAFHSPLRGDRRRPQRSARADAAHRPVGGLVRPVVGGRRAPRDARQEALAEGLRLTAAEAFVRAAIYYHYGKHLFADRADEFRRAHEAMLRCYSAAAPMLDPPIERVEFPFEAWRCRDGCASRAASRARRSRSFCRASTPARRSCTRGPRAFVDRGLAALTLDGPGQGETSFSCR